MLKTNLLWSRIQGPAPQLQRYLQREEKKRRLLFFLGGLLVVGLVFLLCYLIFGGSEDEPQVAAVEEASSSASEEKSSSAPRKRVKRQTITFTSPREEQRDLSWAEMERIPWGERKKVSSGLERVSLGLGEKHYLLLEPPEEEGERWKRIEVQFLPGVTWIPTRNLECGWKDAVEEGGCFYITASRDRSKPGKSARECPGKSQDLYTKKNEKTGEEERILSESRSFIFSLRGEKAAAVWVYCNGKEGDLRREKEEEE